MPIRDDSAGSYGTWNDDDLSWLQWIKANASDGGNALSNLGRNLVDGFSPIGTSEQGNMALQVPPIVSGIAQSYGRLAGTPWKPGNAYNLTGVPELDAPIQQDMSNVLLSLYGGNAVSGLTKPKGALGAGAMREGGGVSISDQAADALSKKIFAIDDRIERLKSSGSQVEPWRLFGNRKSLDELRAERQALADEWKTIDPTHIQVSEMYNLAKPKDVWSETDWTQPIRAYHGTRSRTNDFAAIDQDAALNVGTHYGDLSAAEIFAGTSRLHGGELMSAEGGLILPVDITMRNPLLIDDYVTRIMEPNNADYSDIGNLPGGRPTDVASLLIENGVKFTDDEMRFLERADHARPAPPPSSNFNDYTVTSSEKYGINTPENAQANAIIRGAINRAGYDGLAYGASDGVYGRAFVPTRPGSVRSATTGETLFSDTGKPSILGSAMAGAGEARGTGIPMGERKVFHGTTKQGPFDKFNSEPFLTENPDIANFYAGVFDDQLQHVPETSHVYPLIIEPKNPYFTSNTGRLFNEEVEALRDAGHDFIVRENMGDIGGYQTQFQAIAPNTVRSATTGETLFSDNLPSPLGGALATGGEDYDIPEWLRF